MDNTYIIMNEHLYETMVDNIAINHLLILFTLSCTLTMICCSKREKKNTTTTNCRSLYN